MPNHPRSSDEIREAFASFFIERGHTVLPAWPLVPIGDPTSMFTSAGMQQFKPVFTGEQPRPARRAVTVQRVFRTTDIEEVGDYSHLTAFEMLGNFSFGDYFKAQAIEWAWELLTVVYGIDPGRLHATIYLDDEDAYGYWRGVGLPDEHIHRRDEDLNYWFSFPKDAPGASGPCGPDSEIYFDYQPELGTEGAQIQLDAAGNPVGGVGYDDERFLEIWNLVFMELYQAPDGTRTKLPEQNIDTGSGLERVSAVLQGKRSVYETDVFLPILEGASQIAGVNYFGGATDEQSYALRAMAEHCRAAVMLIGDGVLPSNEGRGYVLRRVVRRGIYLGRSLGVDEPYLRELSDIAITKLMQGQPHLDEQRDFILRALRAEEERFLRTLSAGSHRLGVVLDRMERDGEPAVPGADAFQLYDTFGLPLELTRELASKRGFAVDEAGFTAEMETQRERAKAVRFADVESAGALGVAEDHSAFVGYDRVDAEAHVMGILAGGELVGSAHEGQQVDVVLDLTPFYPEGGGQMGDRGMLSGPKGEVQVEDTQASGGGIVHRGRVSRGEVKLGDRIDAAVDFGWREGAARNHTGTHLLHAALRSILGTHVRQQGSLVGPERLRFDYTHLEQTAREALVEVQALANDRIRADLEVAWRNTSYRSAVEGGALAFFGDKYGAEVRVVEIGDAEGMFSAELCGGTHVHHTGQLGFVSILKESAVAAGTRRIEAATGKAAETYLMGQVETLQRLAQRLSTSPSEVEDRVTTMQQELERLRKQNESLERVRVGAQADALVESAEKVGDAYVVIGRVDAASDATLKDLADRVRQRLQPSVLVVAALVDGRPIFLAAASRDLVDRGVHAGNLVRDVAKAAGGGGGGRPDLAQAGAKDATLVEHALEEARKLARAQLDGAKP